MFFHDSFYSERVVHYCFEKGGPKPYICCGRSIVIDRLAVEAIVFEISGKQTYLPFSINAYYLIQLHYWLKQFSVIISRHTSKPVFITKKLKILYFGILSLFCKNLFRNQFLCKTSKQKYFMQYLSSAVHKLSS